MAKLIMLVGLSYVGKSTIAKEYQKQTNGIIVSSDDIRQEILGDVNDQSQNKKVFEVVHKRIHDALAADKTVIYDATNLNAKRRRNFLLTLPADCKKICVVVVANLDTLKQRMAQRERVVPWDVIEKQLRQFQTPWYHEGWDDIAIIYNHNADTYYSIVDDLESAKAITQDNPWHTLSIGNHCSEAHHNYLHYILTHKDTTYTSYLSLAVLFHDIGKKYTKSFTNMRGEPTEVAHFYSHQNYGAYLMLANDDIGNRTDAFYASVLITYHMEAFTRSEDSYNNLLEELEELGNDLKILHWCDENAGQTKGV